MNAVGPVAVEVHAPRGRDLVGVGGTDHPEPRHRAQRRELLDRLVGRAVLADADGVVRPHERDLGLHERGEAHRRARVVAEHEERADASGSSPDTAMPFAAAPMPCSRMP